MHSLTVKYIKYITQFLHLLTENCVTQCIAAMNWKSIYAERILCTWRNEATYFTKQISDGHMT